MSGISHIDANDNEVAESLDQRRGISPPTANIPQSVQAAAVDWHEPDLLGLVWLSDVVNDETCRPVALGCVAAGMLTDVCRLGAVVGLLIGEFGLRPEVFLLGKKQKAIVRLVVNVPRIFGAWYVLDNFRTSRIADVDHAKPGREGVRHIGKPLFEHDLATVGAPALVAVADYLHVMGVIWLR